MSSTVGILCSFWLLFCCRFSRSSHLQTKSCFTCPISLSSQCFVVTKDQCFLPSVWRVSHRYLLSVSKHGGGLYCYAVWRACRLHIHVWFNVALSPQLFHQMKPEGLERRLSHRRVLRAAYSRVPVLDQLSDYIIITQMVTGSCVLHHACLQQEEEARVIWGGRGASVRWWQNSGVPPEPEILPDLHCTVEHCHHCLHVHVSM